MGVVKQAVLYKLIVSFLDNFVNFFDLSAYHSRSRMASFRFPVDKECYYLVKTRAGKPSLVAFIRNYAKQRGPRFNIKKLMLLTWKGMKQMESQTTSTMTYVIDLGYLELYLTDTPGFIDSEGEEQMENIISQGRRFDYYINCTCIVIK